MNNSLIVDAARWDKLKKSVTYIQYLDLIAILITENREEPMVKIIKTRFWMDNGKEYTIEEFKNKCAGHVK